jgi:hypothetical protein
MIIQQWDYYSKDEKAYLNEELIKYCANIGITSFQSYVYWSSIEKEEGKFDFKFYKKLVTLLKKYNLKWTPFIIVGPYYSVPKWFSESGESVFAKCLEHGVESKIQSIWNHRIYGRIDTLLKKISVNFSSDIIESVLLGISGNWGESLYPIEGGFLRHEKDYHTHLGFWCGDDYAKKDFKSSMQNKYVDISALNKLWNTCYSSFEELDFPSSLKKKWIIRRYDDYLYFRTKLKLNVFPDFKRFIISAQINKNAQKICREYDFISWYTGSMETHSSKWFELARKHFPKNGIYLVTGGDGQRKMGADFTSQIKIAKKYNSGIRITNQNDHYLDSFILTRWVASASRFYNTYFTTEEAWYNTAEGVVMRLFDAQTSGASGIYYKTLVDCSVSKNLELIPISKNEVGANFKQNLKFYTKEKPIIKTAVIISDFSVKLYDDYPSCLFALCKNIRRYVDFDLLCEQMLLDGALDNYDSVIFPITTILKNESCDIISSWFKEGKKVFLSSKSSVINALNKNKIHEKKWKIFSKMNENIANELSVMNMKGDLLKGHIFFSVFKDKLVLYNNNSDFILNFEINNKKYRLSIKQNEIKEVRFD